jgi:hypothetical protein
MYIITYIWYEPVAMQDATNHNRNITYQMHDKATTFQLNLEKEYQLRQPNPIPIRYPAACTAGLVAAGFSDFSVSLAASLDGSLALLASTLHPNGHGF